MFVTEYIRNCNCNYERVLLEERPEEKKYQYCILGRGSIRYLLPCSLRYIDSETYLYYDISSTQNVMQVFRERKISREWFKDFLWGVKQMRCELDRFLLDVNCIIWNPAHIFQDLERNDFFFVYMPYYKGENELEKLFDFFVEQMDYQDENFVEFIYEVHEKIHQMGLEYLQKQIHEDFMNLENNMRIYEKKEAQFSTERIVQEKTLPEHPVIEDVIYKETEKRGLRFLLEGKKKKQSRKNDYREAIKQRINGLSTLAVCEETHYNEEQKEVFEEEFGKTIYIEETVEVGNPALYKMNGEKTIELQKFPFVIGKKKEEADLVLNDYSVSRIHARITLEEGIYYIEDLNSTNGTFKNGLRLQPYEKRRLESEDELKFGKTEYIYR